MMRSMYAGVAGLRTHQTKMDVIGNNIANVNTAGFRASKVTFTDVFYQTTQHASGANSVTGQTGINAKQIGMGSNVSSITKSMSTKGGMQTTNDPFDIMIDGDAFFIVNMGGANYFTKNGAFTIDANGTLCTQYGASVMGWQVDPSDPQKTLPNQVQPLKIMSPDNQHTPPEPTTKGYITGNIDQKDSQIVNEPGRPSSLQFYDNKGYSYNLKFNVIQTKGEDADTAATNQYQIRITDVTDSKGDSIFKLKDIQEDGTVKWKASAITTFHIGEGDGANEVTVEVNEDTGELTIGGETGTDIRLIFDQVSGAFQSVSWGEADTTDNTKKFNSIVFGINATPNPFSNIDIDFSKMTMYSTSESSEIKGNMGGLDGNGHGKTVGNLKSLSVDTSGKIYGTYDNGDQKLLGQLAVASFANPSGLEAIGNSLFAATQNSGDFDGVGEDPSANGGSLQTGVLEMSNADLSQEFTDMITTQRGFQANSRIITTSDTMLEELINLKR